MFLSKLFKHTRAKVLTALAGLTMILGVGAAITTVAATWQNEVMETKAGMGSGNQDVFIDLSDCSWIWNDGAQVFFEEKNNGSIKATHELSTTVRPVGSNHDVYKITTSSGGYSDFVIYRKVGSTTYNWTSNCATSSCWQTNIVGVGSSFDKGTAATYNTNEYLYSFSASASNGTALVSTKDGSENQTSGYLYKTYWYKVTGTPNANYQFSNWTISGTHTVKDGTTTSNQTYIFVPGSDLTITGVYSIVQYNVTFNPKGGTFSDGSTANKVITVDSGSKVSAQTVLKYGYVFQRWSETDGGSTAFDFNTAITSTKTLYAVWASAPTYTFKVDAGPIAGSWGTDVPKVYIWQGNTNNGSGGALAQDSESDSIYGNIYQFTVPQNADGFVIANNAWSYKSQDILRAEFSSHNGHTYVLTKTTATKDGGQWRCNGSWFSSTLTFTKNDDGTPTSYAVYSGVSFTLPSPSGKSGYNATSYNSAPGGSGTQYALGASISITSDTTLYVIYTQQGFYVVGDTIFTGGGEEWSIFTGQILSHATSGGDRAAGVGIVIPAGACFTLIEYVDGAGGDTWRHNFQEYPTGIIVDPNDSDNLKNNSGSDMTVDIYVNSSNEIYILDETAIADAGYIYYASDSELSAITLAVTNAENEKPFPAESNKHLSDVDDVATDVNVASFDSKSHLYKISFFKLRGVFVHTDITTIVIGGVSVTVSAASQTGGHSYYFSANMLTEIGQGAAAKAVFELDTAMNGKSICDMRDSWSSLKSLIKAGYDGDSGLMTGAKILTCASKGNKETFETEWLVSDIYKEICRLSGTSSAIDAWPVSAFTIPGARQGNESPLTTTLWIVLGAGVAGLAAIGTAYFVSKKKKRHQA